MWAAKAGHVPGVSKEVAEEFTSQDPGGKLPERAKDLAPEKFTAIKRGLEFLREFFTEEEAEPEHRGTDSDPPKGRAASVAFVCPDGRTLFVKRADAAEDPHGGKWCWPGGQAENGEDFADCARREAVEEAGEDCSFDGLAELHRARTERGWDHVTYVVPVPAPFEPRLSDEHADHCWAFPDEVPEPLHPGVKATIDATLKPEDPTPAKPRVKPVVATRDDPTGRLSATTREQIGSETHREDMPESAFLLPASRKYPVKEQRDGEWKYTRNLLLAAARRARLEDRGDLAAKADRIREREFPEGGRDTPLEPARGGWMRQVINAGSEMPALMRSQRITPEQLRPVKIYNTGANDALPGDWSRFRAKSRGERVRLAMDRALPELRLAQGSGMAFDRASDRRYDDDNRLHVDNCVLTGEEINPYLGSEIPDFERLGLSPDVKYMLLRPAEEIKKAVDTANGLPLLDKHRPATADDHPKELVVGSTGTDAHWDEEKKQLLNSLVIWPEEATRAVEDGSQAALSMGYSYVPVMEKGTFNGKPIDGKMTQIRFNHCAIVPEGRYSKSKVADSMPSVWTRTFTR